jgi:hypothetical protein
MSFQLTVLGAFVTCFEFGFSHALAVEFDAICVVYETVENGLIRVPCDLSEGGVCAAWTQAARLAGFGIHKADGVIVADLALYLGSRFWPPGQIKTSASAS